MTNGSDFHIEAAFSHLRSADPVLAPYLERWAYQPRRGDDDPYAALLRAILFQQLAGAAASAIQKRFHALYNDRGEPPTPQQLFESSDELLRSAGVSRQKAGYMRDLALHVVEGRLDFAALPSMPDEDVVKAITAVKGLGEWSAHMFLMFHLGRPDIMPVGDLGVRNGMKIAYNLADSPTPKQALVIGEPWAPFRSIGSWYMWRVAESPPLAVKPL